MSEKTLCLKVLRINGEKTIALVNGLGIANRELRIHRQQDFICIPLIRRPNKTELKTLRKHARESEVTEDLFLPKSKNAPTLTELLEHIVPTHLLPSLPHALDIVGDIAIVEIPKELDLYRSSIGEAILKTNKNLETVLAKASAITGDFRLREFNVIAGEPRTETIHKESGCQYHVDLAKAYFSPRLSHEHSRVASLVKEGETVVDLFAGVGPFSILIAKTHEKIKVYAVDVNPFAIELLKRNIRLNRVIEKVHPLLGNSREIAEHRLLGVADRVIMNLPEKAIDFLDAASKALKPSGGTLHFYSFVNASDSIEDLQQRFKQIIETNRRKIETFQHRLVRETAPYEHQVVLDVKVS